jgi:lactoylglutathione lyase
LVRPASFDKALAFYRDALGLPEQFSVKSPTGRVAILAAGRATLELVEPGTAAYIDDVEVGRRVAGHIRVAFEVTDAKAMTDKLAKAGAEVIAPPRPTPFKSINARLGGAAGLHLTLFQRVE